MVFDKLIARFKEKKSDHPLGSDEGLDALLADIPQFDPGRQLFDVDEWLAGMAACIPEIGAQAALHALLRLDQFCRAGADELLARYLSAGTREYLTDSVWSALETHAGHLFDCYAAALRAMPAAKSDKLDKDQARLARCAARAMRAWSLRKKLQRFRYRTPDAGSWREAHDLLQLVGQLGALQMSIVAYRDEAQTTPLREYLIGLYLEFVPLGNMVPQQVELAEAFLRSCDALDLSPQANQSSTGRIDLAAAAGPQRLQQNDPGGASVRYCSVLKLRGALMKLAGQVRKPEQAPVWLTSLPASREQIESGILTLMTHWAQTPPKRSKDRFAQKVELRVVLGFGLARRMIAASHFARMGRSLKYQGNDLARLYDESRFGSVAEIAVADETPGEPEVLNPLDILHQLESGGTLAQMEHWVQVDGSATGIGVVVPTILPRHRIGLLICLRYLDGLEWRMGLIRRIGRDAENRPGIGIETLAWPSICAMAKPVGADCVWTKVADGGHGWSDAIIVRHDARELILPAGAFVAGLELEVRSEEGLWRVRLESLLDSGPDFERIEFTRIS